ncbi:hypothetical protein AALP_AA1G202800 [Arabis alpina]|uniref:Uncharacterized protein n=2 Tax=Arabis alpina TaxID=50452 RepID=A0A087HPF6_ARAAL|nr:hypothetical protein AALP_AA1G202800 [Arabis alpina]
MKATNLFYEKLEIPSLGSSPQIGEFVRFELLSWLIGDFFTVDGTINFAVVDLAVDLVVVDLAVDLTVNSIVVIAVDLTVMLLFASTMFMVVTGIVILEFPKREETRRRRNTYHTIPFIEEN